MENDDTGGGRGAGEKIAAVFGGILAAGLLLISLDVITGGRLTGINGIKRGCGCGDSGSGD